MSGLRRIGVWGVAAMVGVVGMGLAGQAVAAGTGAGLGASATNRWRVVASSKTILGPVVVAQSRQSAWLLGSGYVTSQVPDNFPAGLHWNGHRWTKVSFPKSISKTGIACAGASSASNVWAFAGSSTFGGFAAAAGALRLEGGRWKLVKRFPAGIVTNCLVESPSEIWVFGDAHVAPGVGTWHLHGHTWTRVSTGNYALDAASASSSDNVWAEGFNWTALKPVLARWNGRAWVRDTRLAKVLPRLPASEGMYFDGVTATGRHDAWLRVVIVRLSDERIVRTLVLHWTGRAWREVRPADFGYYLPGAVRDGHGGWWADLLAYTGTRWLSSRLLHAVRGRWFRVPVSIRGCQTGAVYQVVPVPGSTSVLGPQVCPVKRGQPVVNVLLYGPRL